MTASAVSAEELRQENEKRLRQIVERTGAEVTPAN